MPRKKGEPEPGYTITVSSTLKVTGTPGKPLTLEAIEAFVNAADYRGADLSQDVSVRDHSLSGHPATPSLSIAVPVRD